MDAKTRHEQALAILRKGTVIPATTLALDENRQFDEGHQRLLTRYYLEAGSGGVATAVHSTQFEIRLPQYNLFERVISTVVDEIRLYEEESVKILEDFFSPEKEILPVRKEESYESLVTRNYSKCRTSERIRMKKDAPRMLQFCHSQGDVRIDEVKMTEQGVQVEGAVQVTLLYVTADDSVPFAILQGDVPFSHLIEAEGIKDTCRCNLNAGLEQLSAAMIDSEEIEVKASVSLHAFVADTHPYGFIVDVSEQEMDLRKIQEKPGIVGYLSQQGDTLWDIAREFGTTPKNLREWNHLESGELIPGTRLIILKSVPKIN